MFRLLMIVLSLALTIYALLDCARTRESALPGPLPKFLWMLLIVLLPTVGPIAWIIISRVAAAERREGRIEPRLWSSDEAIHFHRAPAQPPAPVAPDDDPDFLASLDFDIRRRRAHQSPDHPASQPGDDPTGTTSESETSDSPSAQTTDDEDGSSPAQP